MIAPAPLRTLALMVLVLSTLSAPQARAALLWYNGDYDGRDAIDNGARRVDYNGLFTEVTKVYDNFVVPTGQTWTITSVFSNDQILYQATGNAVTSATWEIRRGVGPGVGGTLAASGDTAATQTALIQIPGDDYAATPYHIEASVASVVLAAGTYWLSVIPDNPSPSLRDEAFIQTTSGANSVGIPPGNDGNSYSSNNLTGAGSQNFTPTSSNSIEGPGTWDYSMGVRGNVSPAVVPEPSSLAMLALGCLGVPAFLRLRGRGRAE